MTSKVHYTLHVKVKDFEAHSVKLQNINTEIIEILGPFSDREKFIAY